jgi:E3 ubiquitin-protein ligase UBR7
MKSFQNETGKEEKILNIDANEIAYEEKEEEFTMKEYLDNMNKELLVISKFEKDEQVKKCTYEKGYITQEIYICITCTKEKNSITGMCVGCAYKCHENHDVTNLHFKRNFRCDCGNSNYCNNFHLKIIILFF